jgi:ssDNA-binding replication factor A large subunit
LAEGRIAKTVLTQTYNLALPEPPEMNDSEIVQAILSKCPDVTEQQIFEALEHERNKTAGLIANDTLLRLIAMRHGVEIPRDSATDCRLRINHLVPSMNNVTVSGRVVAVFPVKVFEGEKSGKYASLIVADSHGLLRVMLWNDKADWVESGKVKVGNVVRFLRGYTREDQNGKTELHLSERGNIEFDLAGLAQADYPFIDGFATAIKDIAVAQLNLHLVGKVAAIFPSSTFTRQDSSVGKLLRFTIADKTGDIKVLAWNSKAETLEASLKAEAKIKLVNAKVKPASNGALEVHVDDSTYVEVSAAVEQM